MPRGRPKKSSLYLALTKETSNARSSPLLSDTTDDSLDDSALRKEGEVNLRPSSKRQASIEASRQIHLSRSKKPKPENAECEQLDVSDDEDDDDVVEVHPKKNYKIIQKKSNDDRNVIVLTRLSEPTLKLQCWSEPLSAAQVKMREDRTKEYWEVTNLIEEQIKKHGAEIVYEGTTISALQVTQTSSSLKNKLVTSSTNTPIPTPIAPAIPVVLPEAPPAQAVVSSAGPGQYSLVVDPKTGQVVGTVTPTCVAQGLKPGSTISFTAANKKPQKVVVNSVRPVPVATTVPVAPTSAPSTSRKSAAVVDLTSEEAANGNSTPQSDSKEVSFNRLQGKTFPSLVVVAKPTLTPVSPTATSDRVKLDQKVKQMLMYPPGKLTEYLIQQGLIKSEQVCATHPHQKLKLGMYSDTTKFPFSGGYVWLAECCAPKFVSVFQGSVFDINPHPPSVPLKLIYHWACQTNIQNVIQWVKIDNLFVKGLYTWLRAVCTIATHTHIPRMGGYGVKVEIGVISLGTTTHDGTNRNVKVEVLGVLDSETKKLRLRAIEPCPDNEKNSKKRFARILEPLAQWIHLDTTIVTDFTVDKSTLHAMGFITVHQSPPSSAANSQIMDYLRKVVPRMFQNTLSLLSRQIIQQFLDELVWREWFGTTAAEAYDSITRHLSEQTKVEAGVSLPNKLNKVAANPFKNWSIASLMRKENNTKMYPSEKRKRKQNFQAKASTAKDEEVASDCVALEPYYYGTIDAPVRKEVYMFSLKCPLCPEVIKNNLNLMLHCFKHISNADYFCKYCLVDCSSKHNLYTHLELKHTKETKAGRFYNCLICADKFTKPQILGKHLSSCHYASELPYHCSSCSHKTSNHKVAIDHFYKAHNGHRVIQCPFCLRSYNLVVDGKEQSKQISAFLTHLQNHTHRMNNGKGGRKCPYCDLRFLGKEEVHQHMENHRSYKQHPGMTPWPAPVKGYTAPKSFKVPPTQLPKPDFTNLTFTIPENSVCKECNHVINSPSHFPDVLKCPERRCGYSTSCENSMKRHELNCTSIKKNKGNAPLESKMYCSCGFTSVDGNVMAHHLSTCDRNSAYPNKEAAAAAAATNTMLDTLGLVRKPEETIEKKTEEVTTEKKSEEAPEKKSEEASEKKRKGTGEKKTEDTGEKKTEDTGEKKTEGIAEKKSTETIETIVENTNDEASNENRKRKLSTSSDETEKGKKVHLNDEDSKGNNSEAKSANSEEEAERADNTSDVGEESTNMKQEQEGCT